MTAFSSNIKTGAVFILITAATIFLLTDNKPLPEKSLVKITAPEVPYTVAKSAEVSIPIFSRGKVSPAQIRHITSEVPGLVTFVNDKLIKGGFVEKDELVIQLDQQPFILDIAQKQSSLDQVKLHYYETKAKARVAKKGAGKNASDYALFVPQLRYANSQVEAASAALDYAKKQLDKTSIKAPISGKVIIANIHAGEYLQTTQELAKLYGTESVEVRLPLNDHQIALLGLDFSHLQPDSVVLPPTVAIKNFQDDSIIWQGVITRTEGERDKNQLLYVIATINNNDMANALLKPLLPGSFIEATITGRNKTELHILPRESLQAEDKLWTISKEDRLSRRSVEVLYRGKDQVYVTSGIMLGERIVTGSFSNLVDGLLVEPKSQDHTDSVPQVTTPVMVEAL